MGPLYLLLNAESHSAGQRITSGLEGFGTTGDGLVTLRVNYHSPRAQSSAAALPHLSWLAGTLIDSIQPARWKRSPAFVSAIRVNHAINPILGWLPPPTRGWSGPADVNPDLPFRPSQHRDTTSSKLGGNPKFGTSAVLNEASHGQAMIVSATATSCGPAVSGCNTRTCFNLTLTSKCIADGPDWRDCSGMCAEATQSVPVPVRGIPSLHRLPVELSHEQRTSVAAFSLPALFQGAH